MKPEQAAAEECIWHINVPCPLPDELLASTFARFARHHAITQSKPLSEVLFGLDSTSISWLLPTRLERLGSLIIDRLGMNLEEAALQHTLLPFFLWVRASDPVSVDRIMHLALRDRASQLHKTLGLTTTRTYSPDVLRYCPECVRGDRERYGETYWRRCHQVSAVFVCAEHRVPLRLSQAKIKSPRRVPPIAAEAIVDMANDPCESVRPEDFVRAVELSEAVREILNMGGQPAQQYDWMRQLDVHGFRGKRGALKRLQASFTAYWGASFLRQIEPDWDGAGPLVWLEKIAHKRNRILHPVRQLLLIRFLESLHPVQQDVAFGSPPWPCQNWIADHYKQNVVVDFEDIRDHRHPERVIRRFACSCGFKFTRYAGSRPEEYRVVEFGPLFADEARKLVSLGLSTCAVARALDVDWTTADRFLHGDISRLASMEGCDDLKQAKAAWLALKEQYCGEGAKSLRAREPGLYARLYRGDPAWLKAHLPARAMPVACKPRVNWALRDEQLSDNVRQAAQRLLDDAPRKRITQTAILALLGKQSTIEKNLEKLPRTQQVLLDVCETVDQYRIRRLQSTLESLGCDEPRWRIVRMSGLRSEYLTETLFRLAGDESSGNGGGDVNG